MNLGILHILLGVFLVYTWIYALQWVIGLGTSAREMVDISRRKNTIKWIVPDSLASENKVSVIIAAYNEEDCVCDTIDSLLNEDYPNLEIVLVDDGSKDNMVEKVISTYNLKEINSKSDSRKLKAYEAYIDDVSLKMLSTENGGKAKALNTGIGICTGKYCLVMDADTSVEKGAIRAMVSRFLEDERTIACAGVVGNNEKVYSKLGFREKCLILYQTLEYYRTFYMQRVLMDKINANMVVSRAFAMFDCALLREVGGYCENTIGEDMEITLRLHAFCKSQHRKYRIKYAPDARCTTQFPFTYKDFYRQRRRWQIGMLQSLSTHKYMLMDRYYGFIGTLASFSFLFYEFAAPFLEIIGLFVLIISLFSGIVSVGFACVVMFAYYNMMLFMQLILLIGLDTYKIENISAHREIQLILIGAAEVFTFHILNTAIKIIAVVSRKKYRSTWQHINRAKGREKIYAKSDANKVTV